MDVIYTAEETRPDRFVTLKGSAWGNGPSTPSAEAS